MKKLLFLTLACAAFILLSLPRPAQAQEENISFQVFYDALAPYGEWLNVEGYGYCWRPTVDENWAPYTDGNWAYTDAGWTWCGNEKWSWAPYHYGRWTQFENLGWIWVPGYEWAPAWVSWRDSDDYVGWAPLPPAAVWVESTGFNSTVDVEYGIAPSYYSFCPVQYFGAPLLIPYIQPYWKNEACFRNSRNVTRIARQGNSIFLHSGGPNLAEINQRVQRPFQQLRLEPQRNVDPRRLISGQGGNFRQNNVLQVVAPQVVNATARPQSVAAEIPRQQAVRVSNRVPPGQRANPSAANAAPVQNTVPPPVTYTNPTEQPVVPTQPHPQANQNGQGRHDRPDHPNRPYPSPGTVSTTPPPKYPGNYQPNPGSIPVSISGTMTHQLMPRNQSQPNQQVPNGTISPQHQQQTQQQAAQQRAVQQQAAQQRAAQQAAQQAQQQQQPQRQQQQQQQQQRQFQPPPQYQPQQPQAPQQPQGQFAPTGGVGGDGRNKGH